MKFYQFMRAKRVQSKRWLSVALTTLVTGSFLSLSCGILTIATTTSGVFIVSNAVALAGDDSKKVDRQLRRAERQMKKADKARDKADKHDAKADKAMDKAEETLNKGVRDDPGCNQPGVQC